MDSWYSTQWSLGRGSGSAWLWAFRWSLTRPTDSGFLWESPRFSDLPASFWIWPGLGLVDLVGMLFLDDQLWRTNATEGIL